MATDTRNKAPPAGKKVWRISRSAPMGEWVVVRPASVVQESAPSVEPPRDELPEVYSGSWVTSSYDLLSGSDVTEDPDTLPGELFDELFSPGHDDPRTAGK
jgi:hypothetical protein